MADVDGGSQHAVPAEPVNDAGKEEQQEPGAGAQDRAESPAEVDSQSATGSDASIVAMSDLDRARHRKRTTTDRLAAGLAKGVSRFLRKLDPWRKAMPAAMLNDIEDLLDQADECKRETAGPIDPDDRWTLEVDRRTMEEWRKGLSANWTKPIPVIQAYYPRLECSLDPSIPQADAALEGQSKPVEVMGDQKNLQRIQLNSSVLLDELESISGITLSGTFPVVIAPPYKLILAFLPGIKQRLAELKEELSEVDAQIDRAKEPEVKPTEEIEPGQVPESSRDREADERDASKPPDGKEKANVVFDSIIARQILARRLAHLQCLVDFTESELRDIIDLRAQIANGTLQRIAFDDLWHLFRPGDLIVSTNKDRVQLSKVYFVNGGQLRRRNRTSNETVELDRIRRDFGYFRDYRWDEKEETGEGIERYMREDASGVGTWTPFMVDSYMMAFDGIEIGPIEACKRIKHYMGTRAITELPMYPLRLHPKSADLLARMEDRGRRFVSSFGHRYYEGLTLPGPSRMRSRRYSFEDLHNLQRGQGSEEVESDVYIDCQAYYEIFSDEKPILGRLLKSRQDPTVTSEGLSNNTNVVHFGDEIDIKVAEDFMALNRVYLEPLKAADATPAADCLQLLPHWVVGYAFQVRKWFRLDIDLVKAIDPARYSGFEDLVIPKRYRDLLVALVDTHASGLQRRQQKLKRSSTGLGSASAQIDLVRGKGRGLIILLHGPPGSGKTSTAETIAAYTRRPLYSITCGDIGLKPDEVERRLVEHTTRADKWGCVLLLDEADVFLMQRTWKEMERNALVSIFLRQLEYYSGILFLTTNRPGTIDEAFKSRIHVALRYPSIDLQSTLQMWTNIMNRLERDNASAEVKVEFDREKLSEFAKKHYKRCEQDRKTWNGRQIRNAFQTALALGHYERLAKLRDKGMTAEQAAASGKRKWMTLRLTVANFKNIAARAREFEEYIEALRGQDSELAREQEFRDDLFDPDLPPARKDYGAPSAKGKQTGDNLKSLPAPGRQSSSKRRKKTRDEVDEEDEDDTESDEEYEEEDEDEGSDD